MLGISTAEGARHDSAHAYSVENFAQLLGLSRSGTWAAIKRGEIRTVRLGRRRLIPASELARILGEAA